MYYGYKISEETAALAKKAEAEKPKKKGKKPQNREFLVVEPAEEVVEQEVKEEE